jgi:hypothetical protein
MNSMQKQDPASATIRVEPREQPVAQLEVVSHEIGAEDEGDNLDPDE